MPLIVISGIPSSGKTTRSIELKQFFEEHDKEVHIVSEFEQIKKAGFEKNSFYADSNKEKHIRGLLKSEVLKLISSTNVVILDALNYIKGYRYELFCGTKANRSTQCTVHAEINREQAWTFNTSRESEEEKYDRATFDALLMRYEEPDGRNRWDAPLFMIFPEQTLEKDAIYSSLFKKPPPKPNMSTQNAPLSSTNFLYDLDQVTKKIVDGLIKEKSGGATGVIKIPDYEDLCIDISDVSVPQLNILRRQYLTYSKMHAPDPKDVPNLFVKYLTASLK
ncbi:protein KTI12 homolog [Anoplophora glabripennis]|uniref:protein KTI12 homolog n=1 Tax=Anoplophora glabripennis TaxID=217634 RepID=UPI0008736351|nr:protein KTI12 homolog [Anoplophora glabripennis]